MQSVIVRKKFIFKPFSQISRFREMRDDFVEINTVPTHIFTFGQWIQDDFDPKFKEIVLIISGNPGLTGFYTTFGSALYDELNQEIPVWVIGQAGLLLIRFVISL